MITETTIVNMHHTSVYDAKIDRTTVFGNPYFVGRDGDREEVLAKYRRYFLQRIENDLAFRTEVLNLRNCILACWCSPQRCHGEVIVEWLNENQGN